MQTLKDEVSEWTLPAGSSVKIGGIPYTLASETVVLGVMQPKQVVSRNILRTADSQQAMDENP